MTAITLVNAQIEANESVHPYAFEQDKMAFPRILFKAKERFQKEGKLDLGQLLDHKLVRVFHNNNTPNTEDETLQTAMTARMQLQLKKFMPKNDNMKKSSPPVINCPRLSTIRLRMEWLLTRYSNHL
jgi:hypothetical protein